MLEKISYWLHLLSSEEYEALEEELIQELRKRYPDIEEGDVPDMSIDEAFDKAQEYKHEG